MALEILNVTLSSYGLLNRQVPVYFAPSGSLKQAGIPFYESHVKIGAGRDRAQQTLETKISERSLGDEKLIAEHLLSLRYCAKNSLFFL